MASSPPMVRATVLSAIRWRSRSCAGLESASQRLTPSSVMVPAPGGGHETAPNRHPIADSHLPVARRPWTSLVLDDSTRRRRSKPSIPTPFFAQQFIALPTANQRRTLRAAWLVHSLLVQREQWPFPGRFRRCVVAPASCCKHPSDDRRSREPILLDFPCSPSVTRFGAFPAPGGTARLCFARTRSIENSLRGCSGPCALRVSAFKKSLCKKRKKIFRTFRKRHRLALGSGAHSRRFAQECPEGNTGKSNKEN